MPVLTKKRDFINKLIESLNKPMPPQKRARAEGRLDKAITSFINEAKKGKEPKWFEKNRTHLDNWVSSAHVKGNSLKEVKLYRSAQESLLRAGQRQMRQMMIQKEKVAAAKENTQSENVRRRYR